MTCLLPGMLLALASDPAGIVGGTEASECQWPTVVQLDTAAGMTRAFEALYQSRFAFLMPDRRLIIEALSVFYSIIGATLLVPVVGGLFVRRQPSAFSAAITPRFAAATRSAFSAANRRSAEGPARERQKNERAGMREAYRLFG